MKYTIRYNIKSGMTFFCRVWTCKTARKTDQVGDVTCDHDIQLFGVQSLTVACDGCVHNQQSWTHHHKSWGIKNDWVRQRPSEFFMFFPSSLRFLLYIVVSGT